MTRLTTEQRGYVCALTPIQALIVWNELYHRDPGHFPEPPILGCGLQLGDVEVLNELENPRPNALPNGAMLMGAITDTAMDHADVVLPLCRQSHREAVSALETLIGHPIQRLHPRGAARPPRAASTAFLEDGTPRPKRQSSSVASTDTRTIVSVVPNPKKQGTASYYRFDRYKPGMKVMEAIAAGVTAADIKWDHERGFITLGA